MPRCGVVTWTSLFLVAATYVAVAHGQLVAPGTVTTYTGQGSQRRSYGTVRDPAAGFFVAGSSLDELNGVYVRTDPSVFRNVLSGPKQHKLYLSYFNDESGWYMALAEPSDDAVHEPHGGETTEWLFISPPDERHGWRDRFGHVGNTVIPGAGTSWTHLHRQHVPGPDDPYDLSRPQGGVLDGEDGEVSTGDDVVDDLEELPFQVIYVGDEAMLQRLRNGRRWHKRKVRNALAGNGLPMLPQVSHAGGPGVKLQVCPEAIGLELPVSVGYCPAVILFVTLCVTPMDVCMWCC